MKQLDKTKAQSIVKSVEAYSDSREFEEVTLEEANFYYDAFFQLVKLIEEATGEKLCN